MPPTPDDNDPLVGRRLGEFEIVARLGEGGYGMVYRAVQPILERQAVIKVLRAEHRHDTTLIERFSREARIASRIDHPFAAHIYAFGAEDDGLLWIAMEFVRGTPLDEYLEVHGALSPERVADILDRICEVVQHAHDLGIVHRDIKPANVMVTARAGRLVPRLLDLGIAKVMEAPEQLEGGPRDMGDTVPDSADKEPDPTRKDPHPAFDDTVGPNGAPHTVPDEEAAQTEGGAGFADTVAPRKIEEPVRPDTEPPRVSELQTGDMASPGDAQIEVGSASQSEKAGSSAEGLVSELTEAGIIMGSPVYMAPEQWRDVTNVDGRVDIYALGVLAYEALTGRRPFDGNTFGQLLMAHMSSPVPDLGGEELARLDPVIQQAMAKDPDERYQRAGDFATAFRDSLGHQEQTLPQLETELREDFISRAPAPIARCTAALAACTRPYRALRLSQVLAETIARWCGVVAIGVQASFTRDELTQDELEPLLAPLRNGSLDAADWNRVTAALTRPWREIRNAHPMPELVDAAFPDEGQSALSALSDLLEEMAHQPVPDESSVREVLIGRLRDVARVCRPFLFLLDYTVVVQREDSTEIWMGATEQRSQLAVLGRTLMTGETAILDAENRTLLSLYSLLKVSEPTPGASPVMFLFDGGSRRGGARLQAPPEGFELHQDDTWKFFSKFLLADQEESEEEEGAQTPYLGLSTFSPEDADVFYGREKETERCLNRLRVESLLAVVGPSGAGKSSFVQAGVIPSFPEHWRALTLRPGHDPVAALSARLESAGLLSLTPKQLTSQQELLGERLRSRAREDGSVLVLVIDQFEEVFTICQSQLRRSTFARILTKAVRSPDEPVRVVLTLRDDFLMRAEALPALRDRLARGMQLLATPDAADLRRILVEPARLAGYEFEDDTLADEMVESVEDQAGALPMLAFTAARLWEARDRSRKLLTRRAYEDMGGVGGALARHAEDTLEAMSSEDRGLVREAFRQLVTAEGTRAVLTREELEQSLRASGAPKNQVARVTEELVGSRLLVSYDAAEDEGGERVEIVHETLLTNWPRLIRWRQADAAGARLRDQLRDAARQWDERGRSSGLLWRGDAVTELQLWRKEHGSGLSTVERAFVTASLGELARGKRLRRWTLVAVLTGLVVLVAVLLWMNAQTETERSEAEKQRRLADEAAAVADEARLAAEESAAQAREMLAGLYAEQGRQELLDGDPRKALVMLAEAIREFADPPVAVRFLASRASRSLEAQLQVLDGHRFAVADVAISPDGRHLVTASWDKTARITDLESGQLVATLEGHRDVLRGVQISADGQRILTWGDDRRPRLWTGEGELVQELSGQNADIEAAVLADDGDTVLAAGRDGALSIWAGGQVRQIPLSDQRLTAVDVSPDGDRFVAADYRGRMYLGSLSTVDASVLELDRHRGQVNSLAFSPDGSLLASAGDDNTVFVWQSNTGELSRSLYGHAAAVTGLRWGPDGKRLVTWSADQTARIWLASLGLQTARCEGHEGEVTSADFSPDGTTIVTASTDRTVRVWNARSGQRMATLVGHTDEVLDVEFSTGDRVVSAGRDKTARIWKAASGTLIESLAGHAGAVTDVLFADEGRILTGSADRRVLEWQGGEPVAALEGHKAKVVDVAAHEAHRATIDEAGRAALWLESGELLSWLTADDASLAGDKAHQYAGHGIAFSPDGTVVATWGADAVIRLWDGQTGNLLRPLEGHTGGVTAVAFSPDGARLASASDAKDKSARVWDVKSGEQLARMEGHVYELTAVAFSPDGQRIATASSDKTARIWSAADGALLLRLEGHGGRVYSVAFSPDGSRLVTAAGDNTSKVWDGQTGTMLASLEGHTDSVIGGIFDQSGQLVFTASADTSARVWDAETGHLLARLDGHTEPLTSMDEAGSQLATASSDGTARLWDVSATTSSAEDLEPLLECVPFHLVEGRLLPRSPAADCTSVR